MQAVNNYVIVEKLKIEAKKVGGLILTEDIDEDNRYIKAKVVSLGKGVEGIKVNDMVYYDKHAGHGVQFKDILYYVIRSGDIVLID
jgi:co-chaperonin GroES (HSP10)|tara:strand:- start:853 stop:1110 length:258 start_codon:yes stop_codon:yes gene_type:complete